jgi:hypothetical protein
VGVWCGLGLLESALGLVIFARLSAVLWRTERMVARFEAGRLWRLGARVAVVDAAAPGSRCRAVRVWPFGFGWLVRLAGWRAAGYGSQLRAVLETPEMVALLVACPQAGRVLLPVCRMLAVETSLLRPGVAGAVASVAVVVAEEEVRKRVRKPRAPVDWGRIPLPRGVLSAARRQGYGKIS